MARLAIQSQAAPAAQGPIETQIQDLVAILLIACVGSSLADPGILLGAVESAWSALFPIEFRDLAVFVLLVVLLVLRPSGLFGLRDRLQLTPRHTPS